MGARHWWVVAAVLLCISCCLCRTSLSTRWPQDPDHALPSISGLIGQVVAEPLHHHERALDKQNSLFSEEDGQVMGYIDGGGQEEEEEEHEHHRKHDEETQRQESFVLEKPIKIIKTDAGELSILPQAGINSELVRKRIGLGFLSLEPKALLLPQYIDADCLFLVHKGRGRLSWVEGDVQEVDVEEGDVFGIESGTVFHVLNQDEGQRLSIFSIYDTSTVFNDQIFHSFFVAGGEKPKTILSGFDEDVLATVLKAPADEVRDMLSSQTQGPIIYFSGRNESKRGVAGVGKSLTEMLDRYIGLPNIFPKDSTKKPYNLFKKKTDFSNDYGSTAAIHGKDFSLLKGLNKGVFLVRLKAGAVLAPHWNPRATEIALVTKGEGEIQIVYPNGTAATTQRVREGNVFYVPQNFPMCQIASRSGPFEFMGFTTSSRPNRPQFLAGSNSVLKGVDAEVLAASFNIPVEHLQHFLDLQSEAVILPGQPTR